MDPVTLVILAAGMGNRYGGLKQLEPVGPNGEVILDYSVYDAIRTGFSKVVFVIRQDFADEFRKKISDKFSSQIKVEFVFQTREKHTDSFLIPAERQKPWGTGHAVLCASEAVDQPFVVINADDFYGRQAFDVVYNFLAPGKNKSYCMAGFLLKHTLSQFGHVSRGICSKTPGGFLGSVTEHLNIRKKNGVIISTKNQEIEEELTGNETVSMNFWGFLPEVFDQLADQFQSFLDSEPDKINREFHITSAVDRIISSGFNQVKILECSSSWFGVTYPQDRASAAERLKEMIHQGNYTSPIV